MRPAFRLLFLALAVSGGLVSAARAEPPAAVPLVPTVLWNHSYAAAMDAAERQRKMLLIWFIDPQYADACRQFEDETLLAPGIRRKLRAFVRVRVPVDCKITVDGKELTVIEHESFREMLGRPGIAIVDFTHADTPNYGRVVSTFPLSGPLWYSSEQMAAILDLPPGSLTQRTLIYAVRTHPEQPASARGEPYPQLVTEAEGHSTNQARLRLQGHHWWDVRFRRINPCLPTGCWAREVCAESWPGQNLVEAAVECVRCWRYSSGHWNAVRAANRAFGYDMKQGDNGIWYATGIFGGAG